MIRILLVLVSALSYASIAGAADDSAKLIPVSVTCIGAQDCRERDAIIFVHGIYGNDETFKNGNFDWPSRFPRVVEDRTIDVFRIEYKTKLIAWLKKNVATLDEVVDSIFEALQGPPPFNGGMLRWYRSIGFVAHSLGGNVVAAYLHTVKSELGHTERGRHSYVVTLGTPVNGAEIANLGLSLKSMLGMNDPLLSSLSRDNTFVRMMARWRDAESAKARRFGCRPVNLYVGLEKSLVQIVPQTSGENPVRQLAKEIKQFDFDHSRIAKPESETSEPFVWVEGIVKRETRRINDWNPARPLCDRDY